MSDHDGSDRGRDKPRSQCQMILNPNAVAALFTEVIEGEYDGKPVMVLAFKGVVVDGEPFKLGFSEPAVNALMARCVGFKEHLVKQQKALALEGKEPRRDEDEGCKGA